MQWIFCCLLVVTMYAVLCLCLCFLYVVHHRLTKMMTGVSHKHRRNAIINLNFAVPIFVKAFAVNANIHCYGKFSKHQVLMRVKQNELLRVLYPIDICIMYNMYINVVQMGRSTVKHLLCHSHCAGE